MHEPRETEIREVKESYISSKIRHDVRLDLVGRVLRRKVFDDQLDASTQIPFRNAGRADALGHHVSH